MKLLALLLGQALLAADLSFLGLLVRRSFLDQRLKGMPESVSFLSGIWIHMAIMVLLVPFISAVVAHRNKLSALQVVLALDLAWLLIVVNALLMPLSRITYNMAAPGGIP
jgi:hypothetical protein